jgi:hypothetical protein
MPSSETLRATELFLAWDDYQTSKQQMTETPSSVGRDRRYRFPDPQSSQVHGLISQQSHTIMAMKKEDNPATDCPPHVFIHQRSITSDVRWCFVLL